MRRHRLKVFLLAGWLMNSNAAEHEISKEAWINEFTAKSQALAEQLCEDGSFFSVCYTMSESACQKAVVALVSKCLSKHDDMIPPAIRASEDEPLAHFVGTCVGFSFARRYSYKFDASGDCHETIKEHMPSQTAGQASEELIAPSGEGARPQDKDGFSAP